MPYYHVYVAIDGEEAEETDLSKEELIKHIVKPFSQRKRFLCKGSIVYPDEVTIIRIIETEKPSSELLQQIRTERGADLLGDFLRQVSNFKLLEEKGREVTREFITGRAQRRRKKTLGKKKLSKNVFIVHGRDDKPKLELARMTEKLGFNAIILSEQPDKGRTIIEKLEQETLDIGYAFIILTPDDSAFPDELPIIPSTRPELKRRARQNVILELGYFVGKIGRNRVCCLYKGDVELPSDIHGVLFKKFNESVEECYKGILEELKAAGYDIRI